MQRYTISPHSRGRGDRRIERLPSAWTSEPSLALVHDGTPPRRLPRGTRRSVRTTQKHTARGETQAPAKTQKRKNAGARDGRAAKTYANYSPRTPLPPTLKISHQYFLQLAAACKTSPQRRVQRRLERTTPVDNFETTGKDGGRHS